MLVGAPSYLGRIRPIRSPQDVVGAVMLQPIRRPNLWRDWLLEAGIEHANSWAGPRFKHYYMIIQAALAGLGLAILPRLIITEELKSGRLVDPLGKEFTSPDCYCLVYPQAKENDVALRPIPQMDERRGIPLAIHAFGPRVHATVLYLKTYKALSYERLRGALLTCSGSPSARTV